MGQVAHRVGTTWYCDKDSNTLEPEAFFGGPGGDVQVMFCPGCKRVVFVDVATDELFKEQDMEAALDAVDGKV